jgi:hypothetical protein
LKLPKNSIVNCIIDATRGGVSPKLTESMGGIGLALQYPRIAKKIMSLRSARTARE